MRTYQAADLMVLDVTRLSRSMPCVLPMTRKQPVSSPARIDAQSFECGEWIRVTIDDWVYDGLFWFVSGGRQPVRVWVLVDTDGTMEPRIVSLKAIRRPSGAWKETSEYPVMPNWADFVET